MKKTSLCIWLMAILPVLIYGEQPQCSSRTTQHCTQKDINAAWIKVPWSHGGAYYHNTITREDRDTPPTSQ